MAEEAPVDVPVAAEPVAEAEQPAAAEAQPEQPAAEAEQGAEAEAGQKRGRDEEAAEIDGEPDAKRLAPADGEGDAAAEPAAAAADGIAAAGGVDSSAHAGTGAEQPVNGNPGVHAAEAAAGGNPGDGDHSNPGAPPPVRDGFPVVQNEDGSISEILAISKHLVGKLIGKGGTTIQQLQATTSTSIQIDQEGNEFPDAKKVTVRGSAENVASAKAQIKQVLEEAVQPGEGEVEERVACPSSLVGRIIGRGGETIRSLQGGSGAHILVDQNYPEGADRMVVVKGRPDSVQRATAMVKDLISGEPGTASQIIAKHGVGSTITLQCPRGIVGRVIGKGGETIKGLQRKYHVSIQIDQGGDPMNVTITGPKHTSEACRQEVMALISDPMGPPFGDMGPRPGGGFPRPGGFGPPFGAPAPYSAPPAGYGGYAPPYGAPYGAPAPYGGYGGGYPPAGGYGGGYGAPAGAYGAPGGYGVPAAGGYGAPAAGGYGQQQPQYGGPASGGAGYGTASSPTGQAGGAYGQQQQAPAQAGGYGGGDAGGAAAGGYGAAAGGYGGAASGGAASGGAAAGGSVWSAMQDDQGRTYYYNTQTGVSQWEKPEGMP